MTQEELKKLINYNPHTGIFINLVSRGAVKAGSIINRGDGKGYIRTRINRKDYFAHRLAWLYMTGSFPENHIDHINHDRSDNRWVNLRKATYNENQKNRSMSKNNKSRVTGVVWNKKDCRWRTYISVNKKPVHLGNHADLFEAICIRKSAENKCGYHNNHGMR